MECRRKQLNHHHHRLAAARLARQPAPPLFPLYVLCAGRPSGYLRERRLRKAQGWQAGFYYTDDHARLWVVSARAHLQQGAQDGLQQRRQPR